MVGSVVAHRPSARCRAATRHCARALSTITCPLRAAQAMGSYPSLHARAEEVRGTEVKRSKSAGGTPYLLVS